MGACVTEEQAIAHAQYLDLVYSQSGTLYDYFPDAPRPGTSKALPTPSIEGIIGSVNLPSKKTFANPGNKKSNAPNENTSKAVSNSGITSKVNVVQSTTTDKASKGKKREKERIKRINLSRIPLNLHLRRVPNASSSTLVLSVTRITIPKTAQGGPKLFIC